MGSSSLWPRRTWHIASPDTGLVATLMRTLDLPRPLATAMVSRGLSDPAAARDWIDPKLANLVPPERFPGIERAADRLRAAVARGDPIAVFGDFDADGLSATTVLVTALESIGARVVPFIPDRTTEGYGFTEAAVTRLFREHPGTRLVVTVDCGISQIAGCELCRAKGADVVLTDHHTPPDVLPSVSAIVHPALPGVPPAACELAGVGVAFKLAHALARGPNGARLFPVQNLLPLVALGTVADIVPLVGENRLLVAAGLQLLRRGLCPGLTALADVARLKRAVRAVDIAFKLAPRINAAGRIGNPMDALRLLRAKTVQEAQPIARILDDLNAERQSMEREATDAAMNDLTWRITPDSRSAVVASEDWHPGVIGLVAGKLCQRLGVPSIAFHIDRENGTARGSARCPSCPGLDLMDILGHCSSEIRQFGGHSAAAGLSVALDRLEAFKEAFENACSKALPEPVREELLVDAWVDPTLLSVAFHDSMERLEPTGAANPAPVWALQGAELTCEPLAFGKEGQHRRLMIRRPSDTPLEAVLFNVGDLPMPWKAGDRLDIAFTTDISDFQGGTLQILVEDVRPAMP